MQGAVKYIRIYLLLGFVISVCSGCATSHPVDKPVGASAEVPLPAGSSLPKRSDPALQLHADRISIVRISEQGSEVFVTILGTGTFKNYQFQRTGENQFVLNLADVAKDAPRPPLPTTSGAIKLAYRDSPSSKGLQVFGTLKNPLDRYYLSTIDNGLVLRLSVVSREPKTLKSPLHAEKKSLSIPKFQDKPKAPSGAAMEPPKRLGPSSRLESGLNLTKTYTGKAISLDLLDADIKNVLRLIAEITGSNMVIEPDVAGQVTLKVEQVPWDQVLDLILSMNNLGKEEVGNVIRIATRTKLKQEWKEQEEALKAQQQLLEAAKDFGDITTEYLAVNYAKPTEIAAKINEIKSSKGKISIDERTSLIIYTDYQSRLQNAKTLIARLDKPTTQVMIEARIVQLNRNASRDLGITWNFFLQHVSDDGSFFSQDFLVDHPGSDKDLFGFAFGQLTGQTIWAVDLVLTALESSGEGLIVSAPRVLTLDNVQALIEQGTQIPYLVLSDQNVASTTLVNATLKLQVTPHITPDERVRLEIDAQKDQPDFANPVGIQGQVPILTRKIQTELLVDNGAVIVIGGIIENTDERSEEGTPGLSKVPILGRLFKRTSVRSDKTELLIFISPKIVGFSSPAEG